MTPQEEKALLLRVVTQLAAKFLLKGGGFIPFGATLGPDKNVDLLMPEGMKKHVRRDELDNYFGEELRRSITAEKRKTACFCVHVGEVDGKVLTPGVLVHIEHAVAYAEDVLYPYQLNEVPEVVFGNPTIVSAERNIFIPE
jgi:hypothetical protein